MSHFDLAAVKAADDGGPVTMLNLLKYREQSLDGDGTGRQAYTRYTDKAQRYVEAHGGKVLWAGVMKEAALNEGGSDIDWDWGLLVWYPNRAAFVDMVTSPEYLEANEHRKNGTSKHVILASKTLLFEPPPDPSLDRGVAMHVVLIETEGRGGIAEVEANGQPLKVVDAFSPADRPRKPGTVAAPRFQVVASEPASWERAFARNPGNETRIEPLFGWRHLGFGRIVAIDPIRLDVGILMLELDLRAIDPGYVGRFATIEIDRIVLSTKG
ncbi:MAG: DUF1330 domain-containing protein [Deltaproteobacteria bacterium]|nr:MAG: DUF1330 domain-containing protein [Deltaproteobacteria bacterium]